MGVLGLSYKPATPVVEESQSLELSRRLADSGVRVVVHDPMAIPAARAILGESVGYAESATECAGHVDVLVVATPWDEYSRLDPAAVRPGTTLVDCWRILAPERFAHATHLVLGRAYQKEC